MKEKWGNIEKGIHIERESVCVCVREREEIEIKTKKRKSERTKQKKKIRKKSVSDRIWEAKCKQVRINNQAYEKKYKNKQ